ncbi:MAG: hypothetical protein GTO67_04075 [Gammaproteobacteria bacterium]|nr:hypothetical protein [Gammaproteobacteria bacterium]NIT15630.1 hypothetical protein [Gammaproteobacteria bacterium]
MQLNDRASVAASAAAAWSKRENRERLPAELVELATRIRVAGSGTPIKERWIKGPGAPLITALDSLASNPGAETIESVRREVLRSKTADPILQIWRRAYEAEKQGAAVTEEMEKIPTRAARLTHWKSGRPASLPATLDVVGAFDGDDTHPVWAFLKEFEEWSERWAIYRDKDAPALEQTANTEGTHALRCLQQAAEALPQCEQKTWFQAFVKSSAVNEPWPVDEMTERAATWRPDRLEAEIEKLDAQLERGTFETVREQWLERVTHDSEVLRSLDALRDHYSRNGQRIEEDGYADFERALKAQPIWITDAMSTQSIPMQPGLFDIVVIDDATRWTLTDVLPLIFRAKRLVTIADPERSPKPDRLGVETERTLATRFGVEEWIELLGHVGNDAYKATMNTLPGRQADVISLLENG